MTSNAYAHTGAHLPFKSIFKKSYKYRINSGDEHLGHFYVKKSNVSRKLNEKIKVEHSIHLDETVVEKTKIYYKEKSNILSYSLDLADRIYFFQFHLEEDFLNASNLGSVSIFDKNTNEFNVSLATLDPLDESSGEDSGHQHNQ